MKSKQGEYTIPYGVITIGDYAFSNCKLLTDITVPNSITSIGNCSFANCTNLSNIVLSDNVTSIGDSAFGNCTTLKNISIPEGVKTIGSCAFLYCTALSYINIPDGITTIEYDTFFICNSLAAIKIPISVTTIDWEAFGGCTQLKDIYYEGSENDWNDITIEDDNDILKTATIHYNSGFAKSGTYTITDLSKTTNGIKMSVHSNSTPLDTQQAMVACYNNGILTDIEIKTISPSDIDQIITFDIDTTNATLIKGFIWNNTKKLLPVSNVYSLEQ